MDLFQGHKVIAVPKNVTAWDIDPYSKAVLLNPEQFLALCVKKDRLSTLINIKC